MKHLLLLLPRHFLLWMCIFPLTLTACLDDNVSCVTDAFDTVRVAFRKLDLNNPRRDTLYIESILASNGAYLDVQDSMMSNIALPLNPTGNQVSFYINWREDTSAALQTDTLLLDYDLEQRLVSPECGVEQRYVNLRSSPAFDSLLIVDPDINLFTNPNLNIYTCQYEYTQVVRARFYEFDSTALTQNVNNDDLVELRLLSLTDDMGNVILDEAVTTDRISLPVDIDRNNTTYFFEIENEAGEIVNRRLNVSYLAGNVQIFECLPQTRVNNLTVNNRDFDFREVQVEQAELNINNNLNLEIFF